jgi:hypothetical protein
MTTYIKKPAKPVHVEDIISASGLLGKGYQLKPVVSNGRDSSDIYSNLHNVQKKKSITQQDIKQSSPNNTNSPGILKNK